MTTNEYTKAVNIRIGNGQVVHHGIETERGIVSYCGAEGRRYIASRIVKTDAPVSCGRCSDQPAPVSKRNAAPVQTADDLRRILEGQIARLTESLTQYRSWLAAHPGDAGLIESIERAEAGIAKAEAELAALWPPRGLSFPGDFPLKRQGRPADTSN